jgi:hypothetical protein
MAQGKKVEKPTRKTPRFITCSMVLSATNFCLTSWAHTGPARHSAVRAKQIKSQPDLRRFIIFLLITVKIS